MKTLISFSSAVLTVVHTGQFRKTKLALFSKHGTELKVVTGTDAMELVNRLARINVRRVDVWTEKKYLRHWKRQPNETVIRAH